MNLAEFLKDKKVEIPMLQRDYAQGRASQKNIAKRFLDAIFEVLEGKRKNLHIDFIYGHHENGKENGKFLLLDGQQRLTTLWLLHFYFYKKAGRFDEAKNWLKNFSYATRKSSVEFCKNLLRKDFDLARIPSEAIRSQVGEFANEENLHNDPTIKAMLNMLDWIFECESSVANAANLAGFADNLNNITFELFDMQEFELGEDLYIKMNARGRQLSKYENLKAFMEKGLKNERDLLISIDTKWSDYFFDFSSGDAERFDTRGKNFLHYATLFFKLDEAGKKPENIKEIIENPNRAVDDFYAPLQMPENAKLLDRFIALCLAFERFGISEKPRWREAGFFDRADSGDKNLSLIDICYFYSILAYLRGVESIETVDKNALNDYLRVCRHLVENHLLDSQEHIDYFHRFFIYLSQGSTDIYQFLADNPTHTFHSNIYALEAKKARLILKSRAGGEAWEEILNQTSEHKILKGWVDFLLDFSDDYFDFSGYNKSLQEYKRPNLENFKEYATLTMEILDSLAENSPKDSPNENLALFQRALLCRGDFGFYKTNYFYGNNPFDIFRDREALNWLLRGSENAKKEPYFKWLLDSLLESECENLEAKLQGVIDGTALSPKPWWRQILIGRKEIFELYNAKKQTFQRYARIWRKSNERGALKIELLEGLRRLDEKKSKDLLALGFYYFCKERGLAVSKEFKNEKDWQFKLDGKKVFCDSLNEKIRIGFDDFSLNLNGDVFGEFERILGEIRR